MNTEVEKLTAFQKYEQFRIIYNEKKTMLQAQIEAEQYQLGLLQDELYILERKRKSKYKADHIVNKQIWITYKENDIKYSKTTLFELECKNHFEFQKLRESGEAIFEVVEVREDQEPFMTYYNITEKAKLPIVEHTDKQV